MKRPRVLMHMTSAREHMGGGALSMWRVIEALRERGYPLRVTAGQVMSSRVRGVAVSHLSSADVRSADVILTVAGSAGAVVYRHTRKMPRPVVAFVHSATRPLTCASADLIVWGSAALRDRCHAKGFRSAAADMVLWPPFDPESVRVDALGDAVALVNLIHEKGSRLFWQIVRRMPDVRFLGVKGGWNAARQIIPHPLPENAEILKHQSDPREVYRRTRVLLYLRGQQAGPDWLNGVGLAAMEAAVSGIPTIAHPGPGLRESMGGAGIWVDSDDPAAWEEVIRSTLAPARYAEASAAAAARAATFDPDGDMDRLVAEIEALASQPAAVA